MREIKFEYGFESVNGIVKKTYSLSEIPFISEKCDFWQVLPVKYVRQYTGLKDKNGVEIYEGDVYKNKVNKCYTVFFINGCFVGGETDTTTAPLGWDYGEYSDLEESNFTEEEIEVIGNIHEDEQE